MTRQSEPIGIVLLALLAGACATGGGGRKGRTAPGPRDTTVAVHNNSPGDMAVYAVNTLGARWRIGTVMRASSVRFTIPSSVMSGWGVQLIARPVGGGPELRFSCTTIRQGSRVELTLETDWKTSGCWNR